MMSMIDIIIVALIGLCILLGFKKGFMKTILPVIAFFLSVFLAYTLATPAASFVSQSFVEPKLTQSITDGLNQGADSVKELLPDYLLNNADRIGLDLSVLDTAGSGGAAHEELAKQIVTERVRPGLIKSLSAVCAIVLFLVLSAVLGILARFIGKTFNLLPLKGLNHLAGGALGFINGLVLSAFLCAIITAILTFKPDGWLIFTRSNADGSLFFRYFNDLLLH